MNDKGETLIRYRLEQADESLESAQLLLDNGKYRPSVSRSYYAMFYSVLALLVKEGLRISKHTGAISVFNREFVKKGIFDKELSSWLQEAFDLRQRAGEDRPTLMVRIEKDQSRSFKAPFAKMIFRFLRNFRTLGSKLPRMSRCILPR